MGAIDAVLTKWHNRLLELYQNGDLLLFNRLHSLIDQLIELRQRLVFDHLSIAYHQAIIDQCFVLIDFGNR